MLAPALLASGGCSRLSPAPQVAAPASAVAEEPAPQLAGAPEPTDPPIEIAQAEPPIAVAEAAPETAAAPGTPEPVGEPAASEIRDERPADGLSDPLQPINRRLFQAERAVSDFISDRTPMFRMMGRTPSPARKAIVNAAQNLDEPRAAANNLLQRKPGRAIKAAARFVINSTAGLAGMFDVAQKLGMKPSKATFGQTLASYGVKPGAYVYVPIAGPSNVRDVLGVVVDGYFWPLHWLSFSQIPKSAAHLAQTSLARGASDIDPRLRSPDRPIREQYLAVRQDYEDKRLASATAPSKLSPDGATLVAGGGGEGSATRTAILAASR
jgi:phospholipid-binding lipoprotein MlaA